MVEFWINYSAWLRHGPSKVWSPLVSLIRLTLIEADANRLISAATVLEAGLAIEARYGSAGGRELDLLVAKASLSIEAVTAQQAEVAREAWRRPGQGGHGAGQKCGRRLGMSRGRGRGE